MLESRYNFRLICAWMALFGLCAPGMAPLGGCSARRAAPQQERSSTPQPPLPRAGVRGAESGLEIRWWIVDDSDRIISRSLAPFAQRPIPIHQSVRELWRSNGLRIVSVPAAAVATLRSDLWQAQQHVAQRSAWNQGLSESEAGTMLVKEPIVGRPQEEWLGQRPTWSDVLRGPVVDQDMRIALDSGEMVVTPGRMRLLARCWTIPLPGPGSRIQPGLRLELAIQHEDPPRLKQRLWDPEFIASPIEEQGLVFRRLVLEMIALEGEAIVIVPDTPEIEWSMGTPLWPPPTRGASGAGQPGMGDPVETGEDPVVALPQATPLPTLGDCLLSFPEDKGLHPVRKAMLVLIPRLPDEYSLISR